MIRLKEKCEKRLAQFSAVKAAAAVVIKRWQHDRNFDAMRKVQTVLTDCDKIAQNLSSTLTLRFDAIDQKQLAENLKQLMKLSKQLNEMIKPLWRQWVEAILFAGTVAFLLKSTIFNLYHVPSGSAEPTILVGDRVWGNKMAYWLGPIKTGTIKRGDFVIVDDPEFPMDRSSNIQYYWQKYVGVALPLLGLKGGPSNWVKRVIACPGDTIEGRNENGMAAVYLNGKKLHEPYINPHPLIYLTRKAGFINSAWAQHVPLLSMLATQRTAPMMYSFDPEKSGDEQPYYQFKADEVIRLPFKNEPEIRYPYVAENMDVFGPYKLGPGKYWAMGDSRKNSRDSRMWLFLDEELIHGKASFIIFSIDGAEPFWALELIKHPIEFWTKRLRWSRFFKFFYNPWTEEKKAS